VATQGERLEAHDLDELDALARSAGLQPVLREVLRRNRPDPALYLGSGAAERIADQLRTERVGLVLFDHAISAIQQRNLERLWKVQVADRTELIIEIFSQRARSTEGKLQVELARMQHQASRLAAEKAISLLTGLRWSTDRQQAVAHAIEAHSFSAGIEPRTLEARILQDADRLDALGFMGVARCFYTAGRMGSSLYDPADPGGGGAVPAATAPSSPCTTTVRSPAAPSCPVGCGSSPSPCRACARPRSACGSASGAATRSPARRAPPTSWSTCSSRAPPHATPTTLPRPST